jgi:hypothetical protein
MGYRYDYESVAVDSVYHTVGEPTQPTTTNARLDFRIRLRKSKRAANSSV